MPKEHKGAGRTLKIDELERGSIVRVRRSPLYPCDWEAVREVDYEKKLFRVLGDDRWYTVRHLDRILSDPTKPRQYL